MTKEYLYEYAGKREFYSRTPSGHDLFTDATIESGGNGRAATPVEMVLSGLAGCTGIDVTMILEKKRVSFDSLKIRMITERTDDEMRHFEKIHLIYEFSGHDLPLEKIQQSVQLSQDKYCTVAAMLKGSIKLSYEIKLVESQK
jgi:putative redox protein